MTKVTGNELPADGETGIGGENHVRQFRLRRDQLDLAVELGESRVQAGPLLFGYGCLRTAGPTHPWIDFVLDSVEIGRTEQQFAHTIRLLVIAKLGTLYLGALFAQTLDQFVQFRFRGRGDLDSSKTRVDPLLADFEFNNVKSRSPGHNLIEHFGQSERIDNVTTELDCIGNHRQNLADDSRLRQLRWQVRPSTIRK